MGTPGALTTGSLVGLDSCIFIYVFERNAEWGPRAARVLGDVDAGNLQAVTSTLAVSELLVVPYRSGSPELAENYVRSLERQVQLSIVPPDIGICRTAARLRAEHRGLKLPDAIHLATAMSARATAFVTNDARLPAVPGIQVLQLAELT